MKSTWFLRATLWLICVLLLVMTGGCGGNGDAGPTAIPTPENKEEISDTLAPLGIAEVSWPVDQGGVEALIAAMPDQFDGLACDPTPSYPPRFVAGYGQPDLSGNPGLIIHDLSSGDFFPANWTVADVLARFLEETDEPVVIEAGRDSDIVWWRDETTANGTPLFSLAWGTADRQWLYSAAAGNEVQLDELILVIEGALQQTTTE